MFSKPPKTRRSRVANREKEIRLNARLNSRSKSKDKDYTAERLLGLVVFFIVGLAAMFLHGYLTKGIQPRELEEEVVTTEREFKVPYFALTSSELDQYEDYKVKPGDTLWDLARKLKVSMKSISDMNKMTTTELHAGEVIKIPVKKKLP